MVLTKKEMEALESVGGFGDKKFFYLNLFEDLQALIRFNDEGKYFVTLLGETSLNTWSATGTSLVETIEAAFDKLRDSMKTPTQETLDAIKSIKTELAQSLREALA